LLVRDHDLRLVLFRVYTLDALLLGLTALRALSRLSEVGTQTQGTVGDVRGRTLGRIGRKDFANWRLARGLSDAVLEVATFAYNTGIRLINDRGSHLIICLLYPLLRVVIARCTRGAVLILDVQAMSRVVLLRVSRDGRGRGIGTLEVWLVRIDRVAIGSNSSIWHRIEELRRCLMLLHAVKFDRGWRSR
jgi:hypothetical protein